MSAPRGGRSKVQPFEPVRAKVDFPQLEREILEFWREADVFRRQLAAGQGKPEWVFYDGPPTANARPHIGHAVTRTFKDVYPRFRTMSGYHVHRKAGWDCHGLPIELNVEKKVGKAGDKVSVADFLKACRDYANHFINALDAADTLMRSGFLPRAIETLRQRAVEDVIH